MTGQIALEIGKLVGRQGLRGFKPVAYYDFHMDCIRIELRDSSFSEERMNEVITLLEDNYPLPNRQATAGIMVKGVKHFFTEVGLPLEGIVRVTNILDELVKKYPEFAEERICKMVNEIDFTVNMSESAPALVAA